MKLWVIVSIFLALCSFFGEMKAQRCPRECPVERDPVCGELISERSGREHRCIFRNRCRLRWQRCNNPDEDWNVVPLRRCPRENSERCRNLLRN